MSKLRIADELEALSLSHEQRKEAAEIVRNLVVRILDKAAQQAGRRVANGNFADFVDPFSYAKGYEEALNYLDASLSGGRDFQERADWRERMAKLQGEEIEDESGRDIGIGDSAPGDHGVPDPALDEDDELWEDDDEIEWED